MLDDKRLGTMLVIMLGTALFGGTLHGQPSISVGVGVRLPSVEVSLPAVEIRVESDFYEPLTPHGEWVVVGSLGRCWRPARVEAGWRPYSIGYWQRTEAGWYWVSEEPWAWATYHYGRWDFTEQHGWYWVPQTQWAPAWVSWHSGGGYVGWAPLQPAVRPSAGGFVGFNVSLIAPRAFVFVEQRRFLEPVHSRSVVAQNTTIINQTTVIMNTKVVNNTVINEGPATTVIEQASGRKVQAVPARELRHKQESAVVVKQRAPGPADEKRGQPPAGRVAEPRGKNPPAAPESKPEPRPDGNPAAPNRTPPPPKGGKNPPKQEKSSTQPDKKGQRPDQEKPGQGGKSEPNPADKDPEKKPKKKSE